MNKEKYKICSNCVMDTTDPCIFFDQNNICNHCNNFNNITVKNWFPNKEGQKKLDLIFEKIKENGRKNDYDCIIGLSGGIDSCYLALLLKDFGLRPLAVHVDAGWNSELAVQNIECVIKHCNYDLVTHVLNWKEVKDLQVAYLKSGVANQDVIQDHSYNANLYHYAVKNNIKYLINGGNIATESVFPKAWHHQAMDEINLKAIHKCFGKLKLKDYKTISFFKLFFFYPFVKGLTIVRPLNYLPYTKEKALSKLKKIGFKEYEAKHGESIFTKFFQSYYLPIKFNIDKRRMHLSSRILSGEISRKTALIELENKPYDEIQIEYDKEFISKKLSISKKELEKFIFDKGVHYSFYPNWDSKYNLILKIKKILQNYLKFKIKTYS